MTTPKWLEGLRGKLRPGRVCRSDDDVSHDTVLWLLDTLERMEDVAQLWDGYSGSNKADRASAESAFDRYEAGPPTGKAARVEAFRAKVEAAATGPMGSYEKALALGVVKNRAQYDALAEARVRLHGKQAGPPTVEDVCDAFVAWLNHSGEQCENDVDREYAHETHGLFYKLADQAKAGAWRPFLAGPPTGESKP